MTAFASADTFTYEWKTPPAAKTCTAEITPFRYGKEWAYSIENDDSAASGYTVAEPMLATRFFTDAPPGMAGGKPMHFVGTMAICANTLGIATPDRLSFDQIHSLLSKGWGIANHSYSHAGHAWDPPEILTAEQFCRDLFWSQVVFTTECGTGGRAPTTFVYPNGYTDYRPYLNAVGLRSASRVAGSCPQGIYGPKADLMDLWRSYLDERSWTIEGKSEVMYLFPPGDGPATGDFFIDFTHVFEADPASANHQRWVRRLDNIAGRFGQKGKDNLWCAPTGEVMEYVAARKAAKLEVAAGRLTLALPGDRSGTQLTIKLTGLTDADQLKAPAGGVLYRRGGEAWITTPMIGKPGEDLPLPHVKRIYTGPAKNMTWPAPVEIAAVRMLQNGPPKAPATLSLLAITPGGATEEIVAPSEATLQHTWGVWLLLDVIPNRPAVEATALRVHADPCIGTMEIWAIQN